MASPNLNTRLTWLAQRLRRLAEEALERRDGHPDDSTFYHYENAVVDCYSYAARMIDLELAQAETVAQPANVVPFSSEPSPGVNPAQSELVERAVALGVERDVAEQLAAETPERLVKSLDSVSSPRGCCTDRTPLEYIDGILLRLEPALARLASGEAVGDSSLFEVGRLIVDFSELRYRQFGDPAFSGCKSLPARPESCPASSRGESVEPQSSAPCSPCSNQTQSSSSSLLSSVSSTDGFDEEGNAPLVDTSKGCFEHELDGGGVTSDGEVQP